MKNSKFTFLKKQLEGNMRYLLSAVIFILMGSIFAFTGPKLIGIAVDSIIGTKPFDLPEYFLNIIESMGGREYLVSHVYIIILIFAIIKLAEAGCEYARLYASNHLGENLGYSMRQSIFERLQSATFAYHKNIYTGDIIQRCSTDIDTVRNFVLEMGDIVRVVAKIIVAYTFMLGISVPFSVVSFITVPLISGFSVLFSTKIQKRYLEADEAEGRLQSRAQENLSAPRVVRAFGTQKQERELFDRDDGIFTGMWLKVGNLLAWYWAIGDFFSVSQEVIVLCAGILFAVKGFITPGEVISFIVFNSMLAWPIRSLGGIVGNMSKALVALERINEVYIADQEDYEEGQKINIKGDIEFKNVSFSYGRQKIFENLSFTIKQGETVAILGASGSGKSTILALLSRFYKVDSGEITIDGININDINLHSLRQSVGVVMQEPFLMGKSIEENIAITDNEINKEKLVESAKIAQVHETIERFENGYKTLVGEKGVTLSGGQKQRVAIARTLYTGAKVLCFDDSLSAVDSLTDANIRKELNKHVKGITTIIISQRVNTLMEADKILVLDEGKIVQNGTHEELVHQEGIYKEIVKIQSDIIEQTKQEAKNG